MKTNNYINKCAWFLVFFLGLSFSFCRAQTFWTEDFGTDPGACFNKGSLVTTYAGVNGPWTMTDNSPTMICVTSGSAPTPNTFYISATEAGMGSSICGDGCLNNIALTNQTLHVGNIATSPSAPIFCPPGDCGAAYDSGGWCDLLGMGASTETDIRAESPTINCSGQSGITLCFTYMENGDGTLDNATVWYFDGSTWAQLDDPIKTSTSCGGSAGFWRDHSIALPASADGNPNVKIGFSWVNNDDGSGSDPSFAVDDIFLSTLPALPVIGPINVCENDVGVAYTIPFNPGSTYTWAISGGGGSIASGQGTENIMIDWGGSGTYTVSVSETSNCGTVVHIDLVVTVSVCGGSPPIANFTVSDTVICEGDCIDFFDASTNSPTNWTWNFPGSISGSAIGSGPHNICYDSTGTYDVDLITTNTSGSDNIIKTNHITVFPTVNFDTEYDTSMCEGDSVDLHINNLIGGLRIDSIDMFFISQLTYTTPSTVAGGIYYLTVEAFYWGSTGEKRDAAYKYENNNLPITPIPSSVWKLDGSGPGKPCPTDYNTDDKYYFYFTGTGSGVTFTFDDINYNDNGGKLIFRMYYVDSNPNSILWSNGDTEPCINVAPSVTTTYTATVTNAGGCSGSNIATVTVTTPPAIDAGPDTSICIGTIFSLANATIGAGGIVTTWNSTGDGNFDNPTLLNPNYTLGSADIANGSVQLTIEGLDSSGSCTPVYDTMVLSIGLSPTIDSVVTVDASFCNMPDGSAVAYVSGGNAPYTYNWSSGQTSSEAVGLAGGSYSVTVSGTDGCNSITSGIVINQPGTIPPPNLNNDTIYCQGDPMADLNAAGSGGTISWYSDPVLSNLLGTGNTLLPSNTLGSTTYYATETSGGCISTADSVTITINPIASNSQSLSICSNDSVLAGGAFQNTSGTYIDTLTAANGCDSVLTTNLTVNSSSTGSQSISICSDDSVLIGGGYQNTSGTYFDTLTASNGCDSIITTNLTVNQLSAVPTVTADASYCQGDPIIDLTATGTGGTINWYSPLSTPVGSGSTFTPNNTLGTTIYYATETNGNCESNPDSAIITISVSPSPPTLATTASYCNQDPMIDLTATANSGGTITWYLDAGLTNSIGTGTSLTPIDSLGTIIYFATETVGTCTSAADTVTVTIYPVSPPPSVSIDTNLCLENTSHELSATPLWGGTITWHEDIALLIEIDTGNTLIPSFELGTNTYYVTETALCCCKSQPTMVTVTVEDCDTIPDNVYMPNVFYLPGTNADNNKLHVHGSGIETLNLVIYDRWGEIVYETNDVSSKTREDGLCCAYGSGWNGTYLNSGKELNTASFAYILTGTFENGDQFSEKGNITLIK